MVPYHATKCGTESSLHNFGPNLTYLLPKIGFMENFMYITSSNYGDLSCYKVSKQS